VDGGVSFFREIGMKYPTSYSVYNELYESQKGVCKICGRPLANKYKKADAKGYHAMNGLAFYGDLAMVDHCHRTNKTRGILCRQCNGGLGNFQDNPENLLRAIQYLQESHG
jgi:hypothetical protein